MIAEYVIPIIMAAIFLIAFLKKIDIFGAFCEGAMDGLKAALNIAPAMILLITTVAVFRCSRALDALTMVLKPVTGLLGIPGELSGLVFMRPVSSAGSLAMLSDIMQRYGADSMLARAASVMTSSTETTLYVLGVYSGAAGIKKTAPALCAALLADLFAATVAVFLIKMF